MEDNKDINMGLPNYDEVEAKPLLFGAWYGPTPTLDNFQDFKDCGFNLLFLLGHLTGGIGDARTETTLSLCDELGIQAFVDATAEDDKIIPLAPVYKKHPSFKGYNYDEPVLYNNVLTKATGLYLLNDLVKELAAKHPDLEFLVNLNPCSTCHFPWGTPPFTYDDCISAVERCINAHYKNLPVRKWLSCDDYPLFIDNEEQTYFLKEPWLQGLEYLAQDKRTSVMPITTNFFIQSTHQVRPPVSGVTVFSLNGFLLITLISRRMSPSRSVTICLAIIEYIMYMMPTILETCLLQMCQAFAFRNTIHI